MENKQKLTPKEELFCQLYSVGEAAYVGNEAKCYREAFHVPEEKGAKLLALRLLKRDYIQKRIEELDELGAEDNKRLKMFLTANLKHIVEECTTAQFMDRHGTRLSVAPLRSVAVNAAKALMDMYPIKAAQEHKLKVDSASEGGITFNVIMSDQSKTVEVEKQ